MQKRISLYLIYSFLFCLLSSNLCFAEEKDKNSKSNANRARVNSSIILLGDDIEKAFNAPDTLIVEPLLVKVEKANNIKINRKSMMKTYMCVNDLLHTTANLSKVSIGNKIVKATIEIDSESRKMSMYTRWDSRNLEETKLIFTLYYDNEKAAPTEFVCSGYRYY